LQAGNLIHVVMGSTQAESKAADANTAVGTATAQGTVIDLLPRTPALGPIAKIEVGAATNTISVDTTTGAATVNYEPALVKVTLAGDIAQALQLGGQSVPNPITISPGQSSCIPLPAPLTSCITVAGGSQSKLPDGTTHAEAAAVSLQLLQGVQGGINLSLANTVVEGVAVAPVVAPPATPPEQDLARTGGSTDAALVGGLLALALVGYFVTRATRRRDEQDLEAG
jgi:hypothetical protein